MTRRRGDDGVAAVEMAIISTLLLVLGFSGLPLLSMLHGYQKVNGASADTLRYATSVDANPHLVRTVNGIDQFSRRPTRDDVTRFAQAAANDATLKVVVTVYVGSSTTVRPAPTMLVGATSVTDSGAPLEAQSGDTVTVVVSKDIDLSVLGSVANAMSQLTGQGDVAPQGIETMTSTASGREE